MDVATLLATASPVQLVLAASVVLVASALIGRLLFNALPGKKPPVIKGIPYIGGLLKFIKGPIHIMREGYANYGEVFTVSVATKRITFLIGPDVSPHFFKATDDEMSQDEVYAFNVPTFGKGVVFDVERKVRTEQFKWFTEALKKERLKTYVPQFVAEAEQFFSKWGQEGVVDFGQAFSQLTTLTAARTLLGREVRENMFEQVANLLHDLDEGMRPISVLFPYLPIAAHAKRDRAREELSKIFAKIIRERRASGKKEEDVLQQFIDARYSPNVNGGRATTEEECTGLLIAVLFAGQHTSSVTTAWTGYFLVDSKATAFKQAQEEQQRIVKEHGTEINFDVLQNMEVMHRVITEGLRLCPPLMLLMRYARTPFTVTDSKGKEYVIPKGDIVATSPTYAGRMPCLFKDANKFDIDRWVPPREEDKVKPFTFIGFGGGRHACLGQNFAYLQIKTIWSILLRDFDFELLDPLPEPDYSGMVIGPKPCRVKYTRKKLPAL